MAPKIEKIMPSTLETIDQALYSWLDETLDIFASTNTGWRKVPLIWVSAERSYQIKHDKDLRDSFGVLKLPAITVERTAIVKDPTKKGIYQAHIPVQKDPRGGAITVSKRIGQNKTGDFANADAYKMQPNFGVGGPLVGQANFP